MLLSKFRFILKTKLSTISSIFAGLKIEWGYIGMTGFMMLIIFTLSLNIINVYQRGKRNLDQILLEKEKLDKLQAEGQVLEEELEYRQSLQFIESFAHENLNMGRLGERLYKIEKQDDTVYTVKDVSTDPIILDEHKHWWQRIFLW